MDAYHHNTMETPNTVETPNINAFHDAVVSGDIERVKNEIERGATYFNWGIYHACLHGHERVVKLMIKKGADDWNNGLNNSCYNGITSIWSI